MVKVLFFSFLYNVVLNPNMWKHLRNLTYKFICYWGEKMRDQEVIWFIWIMKPKTAISMYKNSYPETHSQLEIIEPFYQRWISLPRSSRADNFFDKNYKGLKFYSTYNISCYPITSDPGRRHNSTGWKTKDFITHSKSSSQKFLVCIGSKTLCTSGCCKHPIIDACTLVSCITWKNAWIGRSYYCYSEKKHACSFGDNVSYSKFQIETWWR